MLITESLLRNVVRKELLKRNSLINEDSTREPTNQNNGLPLQPSQSVSESTERNRVILSEGMEYHIKNNVRLSDPVYRPGSKEFFDLLKEAKALYKKGFYKPANDEKEILESNICEWGLYNGKKVPLDFPMWDNEVNESFADHFEKNKWVELTHDDLKDKPEIYDEVHDMISKSYAYIGGHANYTSAEKIKSDKDISVFALIDSDDDDEADVVRMYKTTKFGKKGIVTASDGDRGNSQVLKDKIAKDFKTPSIYAEVSGKSAGLAIKLGANIVTDEKTVRIVLGKDKKIKWHGEHPDGEFPGTIGWYTRYIGGSPHTKLMVGQPLVDTSFMQEAKYKGREVTLGAGGAQRSGGRAHVYVRNPKTGNVKKVSFGSSAPDAMGSSDAHKKRRKSFGERHNCGSNKDKLSASYWACRATKMFGRSIPGWW